MSSPALAAERSVPMRTGMLTLKRTSIRREGAFGVLMWEGAEFAVTIEHTYEVNGLQTVKIPQGDFRCVRSRYVRGNYPTWQIIVPDHDRILFHRANFERDLDGCIGVGESFALLKGRYAVQYSGAGFDDLINLTQKADELRLVVLNV